MHENAGDEPTVTDLLVAWSAGEREVLPQLMDRVYPELERIARRHFLGERTEHTLEPAALVHEAFLRLVQGTAVSWADRRHFYAVASRVMRRILIDHGKGRARLKRAGQRVTLRDDAAAEDDGVDVDALDLAQALDRLEAEGFTLEAQVVQLRFFGGLSTDETSVELAVGRSTVSRAWRFARAWLFDALASEGA